MRAGAENAGAYLEEGRRGAPLPCGDEIEQEATAAVARLEAA